MCPDQVGMCPDQVGMCPDQVGTLQRHVLSEVFAGRGGISVRRGKVRCVVQERQAPTLFCVLEDVQRGIFDGHAPAVFRKRHAQNVTGK